MKGYKHLSYTSRLLIAKCLAAKMSKKEIARVVGVDISTIYREIHRGQYEHKSSYLDYGLERQHRFHVRYSPDIAEAKYRENLAAKGAPLKIANDIVFANYLEKMIVDEKMSPAAVLGYIKRHNVPFATSICVNTLYSYIEKGVLYRLTLKNLPMKSKQKRNKRTVVIKRAPKGTSIEKRPAEILQRKSFGHWEMDCVCGPTLATLLVLTERLTRKEIIFRMPNQKTESVIRCLNKLERRYGRNFRKVFQSVTVDNGSEFADCKGLEKSVYGGKRTTIYYCHPYSSYERGSNERMNREIRRKFPKGTDFEIVTSSDVSAVETWLNDYPRRVLGWASAAELFDEQIRLLA